MAITVISAMLQIMGQDGVPYSVSVQVPIAGDVVGTYLNIDMAQKATAASPEDMIVPRHSVITDFIVDEVDTATGVVEFVSDGKPTTVFLNIASHYQDSAGRPALRIPLTAKSQVRMRVSTACANT